MDKIKNLFEKNRNLGFLLILFIVGAFGIGVMTLMESDGPFFSDPKDQIDEGNYKELQNKITQFENNSNWTKQDYEVIKAEIEASTDAELITIITKGNLLSNLNKSLEDKTFVKCETFLLSRSNSSLSELNNLLVFLQSISSNSGKINFYRNQLNKYNYYENIFPNNIESFVSSDFNYTEEKFQELKIKAINMPGFDSKYKNQSKFRKLTAKIKNDLDKFNYEYYRNAVDSTSIN